ncbi:MAG TPA: HlyD family type I secretion periplasmic adaptor subunit [Devosiaceae bacterium]|nr:HlyD family type I secretion periplasmic adaptor subunit [Devosiaceae bacterium]
MDKALPLGGAAAIGPRLGRGAPDSALGSIALGAGAIALFFVGFGGWAATAQLDGAAMGQGVVTVEGNRKSVGEVDGGTVTAVAVKDGQFVRAGDVLITLDHARAQADLDIARQQLVLSEAHLARVQSGLNDRDFIEFPRDLVNSGLPDVGEAIANESIGFEASRRGLQQQQQGYQDQIQELKQQIAGKQARMEADQGQIASMQKEQHRLSGLLANSLTTRDRSLDLERGILQVQADIGDATASVGAYQQNIAQLQQQSDQLASDLANQLTTDLINTQATVLQSRSAVASAKAAFDRLIVRAPYEGRVVNLKVFSTGAVVQPGAPILDIVPDKLPLVVNAHLSVDDVASFDRGASVEVRFPALVRPDLPEITGKVTEISADRLQDDRTGAPYYSVQVQVSPDALDKADVALYPGMSATVMIHTRSRTALQYLISPLQQAMTSAFRER